jgi:hypothetical protein
MMEEKILRALRAQAWERAKGELRSILQTYWGEEKKFSDMDEAVSEFIEKVEGHGLAE